MQGEIPGTEESLRSQRASLYRVSRADICLYGTKGLPLGKKKKSSYCSRPQNNSKCLPVIKSITLATGGEAVIFSHLLSFS